MDYSKVSTRLNDTGTSRAFSQLQDKINELIVAVNAGPSYISNLPSFATDALAGTGGLTTGDLYTVSGTSPLQLAVKI